MTVSAVVAGQPPKQNIAEVIESIIREAHGLDAKKIVLGTLVEISREIPENVNALSPAMAEYLAGRFLKGLDICGDLYAMAVHYELKMEIVKKKEFSEAMLVRSASKPTIKTAKEKEFYAYADEQYIQASEKFIEAKMFRLFVEEKKDNFAKAHYLVRKIVDRDQVMDSPATSSVYEGRGKSKGEETVEWTQSSKWKQNE